MRSYLACQGYVTLGTRNEHGGHRLIVHECPVGARIDTTGWYVEVHDEHIQCPICRAGDHVHAEARPHD